MRKLIGTESVRINGTWRIVDVWVDTLAVACKLGPKAATNKPSTMGTRRAVVAGGHMAVVLRPAS